MSGIEITSVSQYIEILEEMDTSNFAFRGESDNYPEITASVFRKTNGTYYNFNKLYNNYYREVALDLSEIERDNFLAYSQHHGLPTPLIDITDNALIALYFACSSNFEKETGYVYGINKKRCIPYDLFDFDKLDKSYSLSNFNYPIIQKNVIKYLYKKQSFSKELLLDLIQKILLVDPPSMEPHSLLESVRIKAKRLSISRIDNYEELDKFVDEIENDSNIKKRMEHIYYFLEKEFGEDFYPYFNDIYNEGRKYNYGSWWVVLLANYIWEYSIIDAHVRYHKNDKFKLIEKPLIPNVLFKTNIIFDRIKSQEGLFLYQLNDSFTEHSDRDPVTQKIIKDKTFIIKNKRKILLQLDSIGINKKNLFLDHDSIAEHLAFKQLY